LQIPGAKLEQIVESFEQAWHRGERPDIDPYLADSDANRLVVLVELIHTDLEYRLKAGEKARVESYTATTPVFPVGSLSCFGVPDRLSLA
jgi:hypothetical protein